MKKYLFFGTVLAVLTFAAACNKSNSDTTTTPGLSGLGINSVPDFVAAGETFVFMADVRSLVASDNTQPTVGLYWQVNDAARDTLTRDISKDNPPYTYTADTLGTYQVSCFAFAGSGYYNTSATTDFRAIDPATVVSGRADADEITVNGICWKTNNSCEVPSGVSYRNSTVLDETLGRLYNWEEAAQACPAGWHLPTMEEFRESFADEDGTIPSGALMADASFLNEKMWTYWPEVNISNIYGFNALPTGYVDLNDSFHTYEHYGEYAAWWTADESEGLGVYLYLHDRQKLAQQGKGDKNTLYMGVRCVKD